MSDTPVPNAELYAALAKAQAGFSKIVKNRTGFAYDNGVPNEFTYADLDELIDKTRPALSEQGLSVMQTTSGDKLTTALVHMSGQREISTETIPVTTSLQDRGAAISLLRRQQYSAILCLSTGEDQHAEPFATQHEPDTSVQHEPGATQQTPGRAPHRLDEHGFWLPASFDAQMVRMEPAILKGDRTHDDIIAVLMSLGKLYDEQINRIRSIPHGAGTEQDQTN